MNDVEFFRRLAEIKCLLERIAKAVEVPAAVAPSVPSFKDWSRERFTQPPSIVPPSQPPQVPWPGWHIGDVLPGMPGYVELTCNAKADTR